MNQTLRILDPHHLQSPDSPIDVRSKAIYLPKTSQFYAEVYVEYHGRQYTLAKQTVDNEPEEVCWLMELLAGIQVLFVPLKASKTDGYKEYDELKTREFFTNGKGVILRCFLTWRCGSAAASYLMETQPMSWLSPKQQRIREAEADVRMSIGAGI